MNNIESYIKIEFVSLAFLILHITGWILPSARVGEKLCQLVGKSEKAVKLAKAETGSGTELSHLSVSYQVSERITRDTINDTFLLLVLGLDVLISRFLLQPTCWCFWSTSTTSGKNWSTAGIRWWTIAALWKPSWPTAMRRPAYHPAPNCAFMRSNAAILSDIETLKSFLLSRALKSKSNTPTL